MKIINLFRRSLVKILRPVLIESLQEYFEDGQQQFDLCYRDILLLHNNVKPFISEPPYSVETDYPIAIRSNDYIHPRGTKADNTRHPRFVNACERNFSGEKLRYMDLGCSGGGLVLDFLLRGHEAVGIEGSDYSRKNQRAEWRLLDQKNLFTADITKPFMVYPPPHGHTKKYLYCAYHQRMGSYGASRRKRFTAVI